MKNPKTEKIVYSISVGDLQEVSQDVPGAPPDQEGNRSGSRVSGRLY